MSFRTALQFCSAGFQPAVSQACSLLAVATPKLVPIARRTLCDFPRSQGKQARSLRYSRLEACATLLLLAGNLFAADLSTDQEIPPLKPPRAPLPPGFWELYGGWVIATAAVLAVVLVFALLRLLRPKPPLIVPAALEARVALGTLKNEPETGPMLSRVSQIVRRYFGMSFGLPQAELTTTEFTRAIGQCGEVTPELRQGVTEFLRVCDERKFAPSPAATPLRAVDRAEEFIEKAEARRRELEIAAAQAKAAAGTSR